MSDTATKSEDPLIIAGKAYTSRLIVGTGKYASYAQNAEAAEAAGAEIVTVALRRVNVADKGSDRLIDHLDPKRFTYLPNTAGCFTGEDAVRTLRLAREAGGWSLVKLEVLSDTAHLYPDMDRDAARHRNAGEGRVRRDGLLPDDRRLRERLEEAGAAAIMPAGSPIGSGLGIQNRVNIRLIVEQAKVPVLVDAGVGTASDAAIAMELGCDAVIDQHRDRCREGPDPHGSSHEARRHRGQGSLSRRPHAEEALRRSVEPAGWVDLRIRE